VDRSVHRREGRGGRERVPWTGCTEQGGVGQCRAQQAPPAPPWRESKFGVWFKFKTLSMFDQGIVQVGKLQKRYFPPVSGQTKYKKVV